MRVISFLLFFVAAAVLLGFGRAHAAGQDNNLLCTTNPAYTTMDQADCAAANKVTGPDHHTNRGLTQTFYPLAIPTLTPPTVPPAKVSSSR